MTDDELLARLRAADPAASLPPADPSRVARLLEDAMSDDLSTESRASGARASGSPTAGTRTRGRGPLAWLAAAAVVLLIVGGGAFGVTRLGLGNGSSGSGGSGGTGNEAEVRAEDRSAPTRPAPTRLRAPAAQAYAARCMLPSAQTIAQQSVAFEGTVDDISDGRVSLKPTRWYHGESTEQVLIESPAPQLADLVGAARFEVGQRYLVSATGGVVTVCGHTAPYSAGLAKLYAEAFPRVSVAGLLLAAGAGRRMGMPKALVRDDDGEPWVVRGVRALREGGCDAVTVVLGAAAAEAAPLLDGVGATYVLAEDWVDGMGASLRAGLSSLAPEVDCAVVSLVDLPDVGPPVVRRLRGHAAGPASLARAAYDGVPGHPVLLGRDHWDGVMASATGDRGARDYLATRDVTLVECGDLATGRDVDTR